MAELRTCYSPPKCYTPAIPFGCAGCCARRVYFYISVPIQPQLHATFVNFIIFFHQLHGHTISTLQIFPILSKIVPNSVPLILYYSINLFFSPFFFFLNLTVHIIPNSVTRYIACATPIFAASCIEIA